MGHAIRANGEGRLPRDTEAWYVDQRHLAEDVPGSHQIEGLPVDADITDLDVSLNITHETINQLQGDVVGTLWHKATVIPFNSCNGGYPQNINATFNDEAYDIITFNQTGQKVPAPYTCTVALPSVGSYNQGQMRSAGDYLRRSTVTVSTT